MAPEQFQGNPVDARTDQFSFCVSLWEQLFGQRPYSGDTPGELAANVASGQVREPASARRAGRLRSILERGLRPDPDGRWPDLASLLDALEHDAARGRRRVAFTAVGAVLVALGAFGVGSAWLDQSRREACASRADAIDEVWNDSARTRLREAVAGTGVPNAESAFEHATPHLDEYAATWRATYAELCVATEVDRIRGAERWSASQACLDDRRSSLDVLLEALSDEPSDVGVMGMVGSVAGLDRIEPCENDAALDLAFADVAPSAEGSQALRRDLQRLRALEATGKYEDATALATRLVAQTQGHHSARLRVEVLEAAGRAAEGRGDYDDAHALIGRAFDRALEAGEDDLAFEAASALIPIVADGQGQLPEAHVWARMASGLEARLGSGDELRRALLHGNLGNMLESAGRLDEAIEEHGEALALYESVLGPNHPSTAVAHHGLGSTQLRRGHHAEALASFSRALEIFERAYGPNHPHVGRALNNIGNAKSGLGRLDDAERAYRRACDVLEATLGPEHLVVAMARVNLAETHLARGRVDDAERIFLESLARIEAGLGPEHPEVARARRHLADLYDATGRTDEAARYRDAPPG
jgi:tetratricopeptide (TPR) repeat protein